MSKVHGNAGILKLLKYKKGSDCYGIRGKSVNLSGFIEISLNTILWQKEYLFPEVPDISAVM